MNLKVLSAAVLLTSLTTPLLASNNLQQRDDVRDFIQQLSNKHRFDKQSLLELFAQIEIKQDIIEAMDRPYEAKPWYQYRPIFVTATRTNEGIAFMRTNAETLARAEQQYGVPAEIITAIIGVESRYGRHKGKYRVMDSLATLGFEYPRRGSFFRKELEQFLLLSREEAFDPFSITGSYAGAIGKPQFMPSSYREYSVDFDADGKRDLLNNSADAIGSVASYLGRHGWQRGQAIAVKTQPSNKKLPTDNKLEPRTTVLEWRQQGVKPDQAIDENQMAALIVLENKNGYEYWLGMKNFYAITRYNHSPLYAMAVFQLSQSIKQGILAGKTQAQTLAMKK